MQLNEVIKEVGMTKRAVKYYEEKGLLSITKDKNGYRDYTIEDVEALKKISIYRKLGISVNDIKKLLEENDIYYQISELGRVDVGGGGTIAYILANKGIDVIDCGVPVLSMHSPYEVTSKFDIYEAYRTYEMFLK